MATGGSSRPDPAKLRDAIRRIVEVANPQRVILFGSAARGEMGEDSDLDLLVIVRGPADRLMLSGQIYQHMIGLGVPVDILVATAEDIRLHRDDPGMVYGTALAEGQIVYAE